ncbi:hypothetical protein SELR_13130 [Selenomonas ruminantium subsp. lactilytica TAM6421]|uniref:Uncharacterized protein n=1 Tax=Selenomonas ruminantium subsp. lactilytica (strain NBRC 103574 / TAM6421) TaxID=927704 RepID=I0GQI4_SELRL|nr:hypothetical protein [Selenomonas ruminantium]BAL83021.1 hypothetical protein SELR_13130 [Selenomonas ruminantium subsp. lactilytica TAM6421]
MKRIVVLLIMVLLCLCNFVEARSIMYANADTNFPIWTAGNRAGRALDISSAVIDHNASEDKYLEICAKNYCIRFQKGDGETYEYGTLEEDSYIYFREYLDGSGLYYLVADVPWDAYPWRKVNPQSYFDYGLNDAYYLVKNHVMNKKNQ